MNIADYMKQMKRASKADPIPGTVLSNTDESCPTGCGGKMSIMRPCCGSPNGNKECPKCHYKVAL